MDSRTIRDRFFAFFDERDHERVPSSSLIANDPNLLLTNAGMNQFKPYFLGQQSPPFARATSVQKCFRTPDIDEVGKTTRHLTFFEMLGNFSFGDYFKEKACPWAWELVTEGFEIDAERLWITIYETDDEAFDIWRDVVGVREERIVRGGKAENFWSMGVAGPCGPDSEIFVDRGQKFGPSSDAGPLGNEERYVEIWNLVFMQNDCNADIEPVADLPKKNIDTGAGVERLAIVLQDAASIYETDLLGGMVKKAEELTGKTYGADQKIDHALRVLGDHGRGLTFLIADGVLPSNEERGYVLRRVMRRAVRQARLMGRDEPILGSLIEATVDLMGDAYPEIVDKKDFILEVAEREEASFDETLRKGMSVLDSELAKVKSEGAKTLPGNVAFLLHDTFGFPIDITKDIAEESKIEVDTDVFEELMAEQRRRARAARRVEDQRPIAEIVGPLAEEHGVTLFTGYEHLTGSAKALAILDETSGLPSAGAGQEVDVILDQTVFYAEGGGQVGDRGTIKGASFEGRVTDMQKSSEGLFLHRLTVDRGEIAAGDDVELWVDPSWRRGAERAHTATHIVHWILRDRLGDHVRQAGSLVEPGRLRFDFTHFDSLAKDQVADISSELQDRVLLDDGVRAFETSFDFAKSIGALAFFGEKYGDFVRVVEVGEYSKELCGGTHVPHTSQIGVAVLTGEGSIAANTRRVEALVGREGLRFLEQRAATVERAAELLKSTPDEVAEKLERLLEQHKEMEKRINELDRKSAESDAAKLAESAVDVDGTRLVVARRDVGVDALRSLAQTLKSKLGSGVVVLGTAEQGRANLVGAVTKDLAQRGISARELLAEGAALLGGGAGGKPELAISGGPSADRLDEAIEVVAKAARSALTASR